MNISVVGSGYVGLVAAACFADTGNRVIGVDVDEEKIRSLLRGEVPIYEPGLAEMIIENAKARRLTFTTDLASAVKKSRVIFLAVGTPNSSDGSADLSAVCSVAEAIARSMDGYRIVVTKSTVPVGTHRTVTEILRAHTEHPFDYVSNPEFLKEGSAIDDFTKPDRVVIGASSEEAVNTLRELYAPFMRREERFFVMDPASAEMTKYAANGLLATRISFMNEIAGLCECYGADVELVRKGVGSDARIGPAFLYAGVGYGGSCFPKDVSALAAMGRECDVPTQLLESVHDVNQWQRRRFAERVMAHFGDRCGSTTLGIWGLAFKAKTDDVRESPAISSIKMFLDRGVTVRAHDPEALETGRAALGDAVQYFEDQYDALDGADALVIFTDWQAFRTPDFEAISARLKSRVIFDGRNLFDPRMMARRGFHYACIGRPTVTPA